MKVFFKQFLRCGAAGLLLECLWTGGTQLLLGNWKLVSKTSLWMFPIYGLAACFCPVYHAIRRCCILVRAVIYAVLIFFMEYVTGSVLSLFHICPWNYDHARFHLHGLIRFDYFPVWMLAGILFERLVLKCGCAPSDPNRKKSASAP